MKPKRIKKYQNLEGELKKLFALTYKDGIDGHIVDFTDPRDQQTYKSVPLETDEFYYLVNIESLLKNSSFEEEDMDEDDNGLMAEAIELEGEDDVEDIEDDDEEKEEYSDEEALEAEE